MLATINKNTAKPQNSMMSLMHSLRSGEFGIVYRAKLGPKGTFCREVAVKTLKGLLKRNV